MSSHNFQDWRRACYHLSDRFYASMERNDSSEESVAFITHESLVGIWKSDLEGLSRSPFRVFATTVCDVSFQRFCNELIRLVSTLVYAGWKYWETFDEKLRTSPGFPRDNDLPLNTDKLSILFEIDTVNGKFRDATAGKFKLHQHEFNPVLIEEGETHKFSRQVRLPFLSEDSFNNSGCYGEVSRVQIAPGYFKYKYHGRSPVGKFAARKKIQIEYSYWEEIKNLNILRRNDVQHSNIMMHIAAVIVGNEYNILFDWADITLEGFLTTNIDELPPWIDRRKISPKMLLREVARLARALGFLHHNIIDHISGRPLEFCHMDFKPNNILVVREYPDCDSPLGKWKITDFGISSTRPQQGRRTVGDILLKQSSLETHRHTGPYQPPEAEGEVASARRNANQNNSQTKSDIWSYGCVLTEILAYSVGGPGYSQKLHMKLREKPSDSDPSIRRGFFYTKIGGIHKVDTVLTSWLEELAGTQGDWFSKLWKYITRSVLKVEDPASRDDAWSIFDRVIDISGEAPSETLGNRRRGTPTQVRANYPSELNNNDRQVGGNSWAAFNSTRSPQSNIQSAVPNNYFHSAPVPRSLGNIYQYTPQNDPFRPFGASRRQESMSSLMSQMTMGDISQSESTLGRNERSSRTSHSSSVAPSFTYDLSADVGHGVKIVEVSPYGDFVLFSNEHRAKVFFASFNTRTVFSPNETVQFPEYTRHENAPSIKWGKIRLGGGFLALSTGENNISSVYLETRPQLRETAWSSILDLKDVFDFDISPDGAMAYIFDQQIKVFSKNAQILLDFKLPKEINQHFYAVKFERSGNYLLAVTERAWIVWFRQVESRFTLEKSGRHDFERSDHGGFRPTILPFNRPPNRGEVNRLAFVLLDQTRQGHMMLVRYNDNCAFDIPKNTLATTLSDDNRYLVHVVAPDWHHGTKYAIRYRRISVDADDRVHITSGKPQTSLDLKNKITSTATKKASACANADHAGISVLVALSDGRIQQLYKSIEEINQGRES